MASSADLIPNFGSHTVRRRLQVLTAKTLYAGTLCFTDAANGYATDVINSGANAFAGVVVERLDNSAGASGAVKGDAVFKGQVTLRGMSESLAITDIEKKIYASDNATLTTTSTNNTAIGILKDIDDNGDPVIDLINTNV